MHPRRRLHLPGRRLLALPHLVVPIPSAKIEVVENLRRGPGGKGESFGKFDCGVAIGGHGLLPTTNNNETKHIDKIRHENATHRHRTVQLTKLKLVRSMEHSIDYIEVSIEQSDNQTATRMLAYSGS